MQNSNGPSIDPWGTPVVIGSLTDICLSNSTYFTEYAHSFKSMVSSVNSMVFNQYEKITINLFTHVKQFVSASADPGKHIY